MNTMQLTLQDIGRFTSKIDVRSEDECWPWLGCISQKGYGNFRLNGVTRLSHRISYFLSHKNLPLYNSRGKRLFVCHKCDSPDCCNPKHLFLGTNEDNMKDAAAKGRIRRGENHPSASLSDSCIWEIRAMIDRGTSQRKIAECYQVCQKTISHIATGKTRKHVRY